MSVISDDKEQMSGGCYCGKVRYRARRVSSELTECHCSQCRKQSGYRYAFTTTSTGNVEIKGEDNMTWFSASPAGERGFCATCGSHLFWRSLSDDEMTILPATVDEPSNLHVVQHIFLEDKGGYYEITDGLPQFYGYETPLEESK
jgi:hypothetical protein